MAEIRPSDFNRRATLKAYDYAQRDSGGTYGVLVESVDVWCMVENLSGSTNPTQGQIKSDADYKVTLRYNAAFTTNWIFYYEGMDMKIKNIQTDLEGYKRFMILLCSVSIQQQSWS